MTMEWTDEASGAVPSQGPTATDGLVASAEQLRRAGKPAEALVLLRHGLEREPQNLLMTLALARVHLELGEDTALRALLEGTLAQVANVPEPSEQVEEAAVVAEKVEEDDFAPVVDVDSASAEEGASIPFAVDSPFANPTMARLLEDQGHTAEADALREVIVPAAESAESGEDDFAVGGESAESKEDASERVVLDTLTSWLDNIQRGAA